MHLCANPFPPMCPSLYMWNVYRDVSLKSVNFHEKSISMGSIFNLSIRKHVSVFEYGQVLWYVNTQKCEKWVYSKQNRWKFVPFSAKMTPKNWGWVWSLSYIIFTSYYFLLWIPIKNYMFCFPLKSLTSWIWHWTRNISQKSKLNKN